MTIYVVAWPEQQLFHFTKIISFCCSNFRNESNGIFVLTKKFYDKKYGKTLVI